jgi:diaminopimelate epimerase
VKFYKYQGTGNDFIILNNMDGKISLNKQQIAGLCDRKFGVGADGLMLLEKQDGYDFKMVYYNSDGGESSMCGNGGRCMVHFAHKLDLIQDRAHFMAIDGEHEAFVSGDIVKLKMKDIAEYELIDQHLVINTGSPHFVCSHSLTLSGRSFLFKKLEKFVLMMRFAKKALMLILLNLQAILV